MSSPFISEIRLMSFNFPPRGWAECNGQLLPINQNQALFSLIGTTYGGNGTTNFALPNLQGRVALHFGTGPGLSTRVEGEAGGQTAHTLTTAEIPTHTHTLGASSAVGTTTDPRGKFLAKAGVNSRLQPLYQTSGGSPSAGGGIGQTGGSQPHENRQPYLTVNFCIALQGIYPSRN